MSIRFYNPPPVLLAKGNKEGVDIGGALSIIAMDRDHNLHIVANIFSELSWGKFWEDPEFSDQIENFEVKHEDNEGLFDPQKLITRIVNAFDKIRANRWIFYGIGDFESNSFMDALCMDLDHGYVQQLMAEHKRVRDQRKFPTLLDENSTKNRYIATKFNGNGYQYFHFQNATPLNTDLYAILQRTGPISGYITGIVCTAQGAANFYIISETIRPSKQKEERRTNIQSLENALSLIRSNVINPISWFRIDLNLNSLKTLEQYQEIITDPQFRGALKAYIDYVNTDLKQQYEIHKAQKEHSSEIEEINVSQLSEKQKEEDLQKLKDIWLFGGLGLFGEKKIKDSDEDSLTELPK